MALGIDDAVADNLYVLGLPYTCEAFYVSTSCHVQRLARGDEYGVVFQVVVAWSEVYDVLALLDFGFHAVGKELKVMEDFAVYLYRQVAWAVEREADGVALRAYGNIVGERTYAARVNLGLAHALHLHFHGALEVEVGY